MLFLKEVFILVSLFIVTTSGYKCKRWIQIHNFFVMRNSVCDDAPFCIYGHGTSVGSKMAHPMPVEFKNCPKSERSRRKVLSRLPVGERVKVARYLTQMGKLEENECRIVPSIGSPTGGRLHDACICRCDGDYCNENLTAMGRCHRYDFN